MTKLETRLRRLEAKQTPRRVAVVTGHSDAEHLAKIEAMIASGGGERQRLLRVHHEVRGARMNRMIDTRLRRLEEASPDRRKRMFVVHAATEAERQAEIDGLIALGAARGSDWFIVTGVPRASAYGADGTAWDAS